jgi:hypothetical protein
MAETAVAMDATTRAMLQKLADIATPPPVSWMPQTAGWAVLGAVLLAVLVWLSIRSLRRYRTNRYRREALAELELIDIQIPDDRTRGEALVRMSALLKRVALAAWPRPDVAPLSSDAWLDFLAAHAGRGRSDAGMKVFWSDAEYRGYRPSLSAGQACRASDAVRAWIGGHVVSA